MHERTYKCDICALYMRHSYVCTYWMYHLTLLFEILFIFSISESGFLQSKMLFILI